VKTTESERFLTTTQSNGSETFYICIQCLTDAKKSRGSIYQWCSRYRNRRDQDLVKTSRPTVRDQKRDLKVRDQNSRLGNLSHSPKL